jgi:methylmalonyl-CoA mutase
MDTMYQRGKIQDESLYYESKKHDGSLPIVGVNTFQSPEGLGQDISKQELMRSTDSEKQAQISSLRLFKSNHADECPAALERLVNVAAAQGNVFAELMETVKYASLSQISAALYSVGGEYRRNM